MTIDIEYKENECSGYCNPNGCRGHKSSDIECVIINGIILDVNLDNDSNDVCNMVKKLEILINNTEDF